MSAPFDLQRVVRKSSRISFNRILASGFAIKSFERILSFLDPLVVSSTKLVSRGFIRSGPSHSDDGISLRNPRTYTEPEGPSRLLIFEYAFFYAPTVTLLFSTKRLDLFF